jgi:hypothetical protein
MRRPLVASLFTALAVLATASAASAQQTLNFTLGYFAPLGEDARDDDDVLNANRTFLLFDVADFGSASAGGEWLVPLGRFLEAGAGVSFSRRTVPSIYDNFVDSDGTEIEQDLRLRMIPVSFTVRVVPTGQSSPVQPYVGAGVSIINWRYSESGEFIDFSGGRRTIFRDTFVESGSATAPVVLGGIRFASNAVSFGGEVRYQKATGDLSDDFAGSKIDLGGWTYQATMGIRFGR